MKYITYEPFKNYINRFLVSKTEERKEKFTPQIIEKEVVINQWLKDGFAIHDNPCRYDFVEERKTKKINYPVLKEDLDIYFPYNNINIENSGFWFVPTYLKTYAITCVESKESKSTEFELTTCGGATVFVNKKEIIDFTPYTRNMQKSINFKVDLDKGINEIVVVFDDLAERDTQYFFALKVLNNNLKIKIPSDKDEKIIKLMEDTINTANFKRDIVKSGNVNLYIENLLDEDMILESVSASETFGNSGIFVKKEFNFYKDDISINLGDVHNYHMGSNYFKFTLKYKNIEVSKKLLTEFYQEDTVPMDCANIDKRKKDLLEYIAMNGEFNSHRAYAILKTGKGDLDFANELLLDQLVGIDAREDCADFYMISIFRIWDEFRNSDLLPESTWEKIKETFLNFRYWIDEPGDDVMWFYSENHALLFHSCQLMAGQIFPDEIFKNSGMNGKELVDHATILLENWFERFLDEGITEWNSPAYLPIDLLGLSHLYALSKNIDLKVKAKKAIDDCFYYYTVNSLNGILSGSSGRHYEKQLKGNYSNEMSCIGKIYYNKGFYNISSKATVGLCTTDYVPPKEYEKYVFLGKNEELIIKNNKGFERHVDLYEYKTSNYSMNTAINFNYKKAGYQEHINQLIINPSAQVWVNHPGEITTQGSGRPAYWAGNGFLPRAFQYKNLTIMEFDICEKHIVDFTHAYFPIFAFDEYEMKNNEAFFKVGNVYGYLYSKNPMELVKSGIYKNREIISKGRKNIWVIRVGDYLEYGSYDNFKKSMNNKINITDKIAIKDMHLGDIEVTDILRVNGKVENYKGYSNKGELIINKRKKYEFNKEDLLKIINKVSYKMQNMENDGIEEVFPIGLIDIDLWEWPQGVGIFGLYRLYEETKNKDLLKFLEKWYESRFAEGLPEKNVNTMSPMLTLTYLYEETKNEKYLDYIKEWSSFIMNDMCRTGDNALQHMITGDANEGQILIDTLFMTCLFLTRAGVVLQKDEYIEEAKKQFLIHIKYLYDKKSNLFYHGYDFNYNHNYGEVHWGRGNAWYTCCLPDFIEMIDMEDSIKEYLLDTYRSQVGALSIWQNDNGLWHTVIDEDDSYIETSATAAFAYGIIKGVRKGYLDESYLEVGLRALQGVIDNIDEDGTVLNVSYGTPIGNDSQFYKDIIVCPMTYGQALTLLLLTEALKL